jgi:2-oxoglutarate dehydrogenase E1 component
MTYIGNTSHLYGANATYLQQLYQRYLENSALVDEEWQVFFNQYGDDIEQMEAPTAPSWADNHTAVIGSYSNRESFSDTFSDVHGKRKVKNLDDLVKLIQDSQIGKMQTSSNSRQALLDTIQAIMLIRSYRIRGHMEATLDPLGIHHHPIAAELDPSYFGFTESDYDRPIFLNFFLGLEIATLREILSVCRRTYCQTIGYEYMHIQKHQERMWLQEQIEQAGANYHKLTDMGKKTIYERLMQADIFENFLDKKFKGSKRFGLDGGESVIPIVEQILKRGVNMGVEEAVIGMAHRGRLNMLANVMNKPYHAIFSEFYGKIQSLDEIHFSGDVKYHLGASADREFDEKSIHLSLTPNPSHLECVNTVVLGKVRAKQNQRGDYDRQKVLGILLHGDAAFIGQGIVAETFLLSQLDGYKTGGTLHIAINNQIGFTTAPSFSRSSPYCSDMAKMIDAPVFHVNGDDPEACIHVARLAMEYRQKFSKDVVIDVWCYRRHGHNESDEPKFTQPRMYNAIAHHPKTADIYAKKLIDDGVFTQDEVTALQEKHQAFLEEELAIGKEYIANKLDWLEGQWSGYGMASGVKRRGETAISQELFDEVATALTRYPNNFSVHPRIAKQMEDKKKIHEAGEGYDWGYGEAIALGSLLCESHSVRFSGEDSQRGTFSHRHAVLIDQKSEDSYIPLRHIRHGQANFEILDSPLSEFGLLGFEYGYAGAEPHSLVVWEAQFGDFANGAQVIIDQFIASGEAKWLRMNGLVMLLPHGYEGQGPEHSSARLERYLQLSAEDNWQVCNITTPANYFHALRRQIKRNFRKPLIQMSPKSLLRHKKCISKAEDFIGDSCFHRVLWDDGEALGHLKPRKDIKRVVLCSGKIYYELIEKREELGIDDVYILRLEQLYPFPDDALSEIMVDFPKADIVWCQEEPENMGAWFFVDRLIEEMLLALNHKGGTRASYAGRPVAASPATGSLQVHQAQQNELITKALTIKS